jgi:hypothetical protein
MLPDADDRARARLRKLSRGLTGKADFRLEVALAIEQLGRTAFRASEVSAMLVGEGPGRSDNVVRNLKALVDAGLLQQAFEGGPYERDPRHPFWTFVADTWTVLLATAESPTRGEDVLNELSRARSGQR